MGESSGIWKWVAVVSVTVLIAGAPAIVYAIKTWSVSEKVDKIQDRQDDVRIRLSILETQNAYLTSQVAELRAQVEAHGSG